MELSATSPGAGQGGGAGVKFICHFFLNDCAITAFTAKNKFYSWNIVRHCVLICGRGPFRLIVIFYAIL